MELSSITHELHESARRLRNGSSELFTLAREKAEAEKTYRLALMRAIVGLKDEGKPATLIPDLARGQAADEKYSRDLADAKYTAGREALDSIKSQVSALQSILRYQEEG